MKHMSITLVLTLSILGGCLRAEPVQSSANPEAGGQNGAKLWAENCSTCHNLRNPEGYSDAQWDVAVMHMRIRANLTARESRAILEFLKTAN